MGLSRNKVAVPEGAAGSPPFYGVFVHATVLVFVVWFAGVEEVRNKWCGHAFGFPDRHGLGVLMRLGFIAGVRWGLVRVWLVV